MIIVPHFSSGIVEQAKRERAWKSPHAKKGDTRAACRLFLRRLIFTSASSQAIFTPPFPLPPLQPRPQGFSLKKWVGTRLPPLYVWVKLLGYILTSRIKLIFGIHGLQEMFFWIEKKFRSTGWILQPKSQGPEEFRVKKWITYLKSHLEKCLYLSLSTIN